MSYCSVNVNLLYQQNTTAAAIFFSVLLKYNYEYDTQHIFVQQFVQANKEETGEAMHKSASVMAS